MRRRRCDEYGSGKGGYALEAVANIKVGTETILVTIPGRRGGNRKCSRQFVVFERSMAAQCARHSRTRNLVF
jgi:hypothetical protein